MTHNKRLTDKLMNIARWYSMPADHFNVVKEAVKMLESAPSVSCSEKPKRCEDAVSRQAVLDGLASIAKAKAKSDAQKAMMGRTMFFVEQLPSVSTEKTGRCKDCKWWKDSDGVYRRGIRAESQCPINHIEVFKGNGYCFMYDSQESEVEE